MYIHIYIYERIIYAHPLKMGHWPEVLKGQDCIVYSSRTDSIPTIAQARAANGLLGDHSQGSTYAVPSGSVLGCVVRLELYILDLKISNHVH